MARRRGSVLWFVLFAVVAVGLIVALRQTSMFQNDHGPAHASTQIVVHVRYQSGQPADFTDLMLLWSVCKVNVPHEAISLTTHDGTIRATLAPALGEDVQRRFVGCLQDLTLPAMLGHVESTRVVHDSPGSAPGRGTRSEGL